MRHPERYFSGLLGEILFRAHRAVSSNSTLFTVAPLVTSYAGDLFVEAVECLQSKINCLKIGNSLIVSSRDLGLF